MVKAIGETNKLQSVHMPNTFSVHLTAHDSPNLAISPPKFSRARVFILQAITPCAEDGLATRD